MQAPAPRPRRSNAGKGPSRPPRSNASPPVPARLPFGNRILIAGALGGAVALVVVLAARMNRSSPQLRDAPAPEPVRSAVLPPAETSETPAAQDAPLETDLLAMAHDQSQPSDDQADLARLLGDGLQQSPVIDGLLPSALPAPPAMRPLPSAEPNPPGEKPPLAIVPPAPEPAPEVKVPAVPAAPAVPAVPPEPARPAAVETTVLARLAATEEDLRRQLSEVPEVRLVGDLEFQGLRVAKVVEEAGVKTTILKGGIIPSNSQLEKRFRESGLSAGLPLQFGAHSRLDPDSALTVQTLSRELRKMGFVSVPPPPPLRVGGVVQPAAPEAPRFTPEEKIKAFKEWCDLNHVEKYRGALATLLQMLQVEDVPTRLLLVKELGKVKNAHTSAVLAGRALMDLSPDVRKVAVEALKKRPAEQYVPVLIKGLRYPWAPVADHAAVALKELDARSTLPMLVKLLDQPDPTLPFLDRETGKYQVREMVRLNHMRNCFLCHPSSAAPNDGLVRGAVPTPGQAVGSYQGRSSHFVRADTTFLRQDFSVVLIVAKDPPWPDQQRFDFVTRLRPAKPDELREIARKPARPGDPGEIARVPPKPADPGEVARTPTKPDATGEIARTPTNYPQRDAVLFVLRGLTGKDAGDSSAAWKELVSIPATVPPSREGSPDKAPSPSPSPPAPDKVPAPAGENGRLP